MVLIIAVPIIAICLFFFWIKQMLRLISLTDDCFPGRYDKIMWAVIVFFGSIVGAFVFWLWTHARRAEMEVANLARKVVWSTTNSADGEQEAE